MYVLNVFFFVFLFVFLFFTLFLFFGIYIMTKNISLNNIQKEKERRSITPYLKNMNTPIDFEKT